MTFKQLTNMSAKVRELKICYFLDYNLPKAIKEFNSTPITIGQLPW